MNVMDVVSRSISFRGVVRDVEVDVVSGEGCALLAEELAHVEKACAAVRALAAALAAACGAHKERGYRGAADWLAGVMGSTRQQAESDLETGARLADCPATKDAAGDGDLSLGQADEITKTEQDKPGSESELVQKAKTSTRPQLADECRKRRQEGVDREELAARQHQKRSLRKWTDADGMLCGLFRLEPAVRVPLLARLEFEADRLGRQAKRQPSSGRRWRWGSHQTSTASPVRDADAGSGCSGTISIRCAPAGSPATRTKTPDAGTATRQERSRTSVGSLRPSGIDANGRLAEGVAVLASVGACRAISSSGRRTPCTGRRSN